MSHATPRPPASTKNMNKAYLWVEGFVVAQALGVTTYLNRRCLAPFGAPIGHISILGAEEVAGLWAEAQELAKASKHDYPDADGSRSWQHVCRPNMLAIAWRQGNVGSASSK